MRPKHETATRAAACGSCLCVVLLAGALYGGVEALDNQWFVGACLFVVSLLLLRALPGLQAAIIHRHAEPEWYSSAKPESRVFRTLHTGIVAATLAGVFWYWASRFQSWDSILPTFANWSWREFASQAANFVVTANAVESLLASQALGWSAAFVRRRNSDVRCEEVELVAAV